LLRVVLVGTRFEIAWNGFCVFSAAVDAFALPRFFAKSVLFQAQFLGERSPVRRFSSRMILQILLHNQQLWVGKVRSK